MNQQAPISRNTMMSIVDPISGNLLNFYSEFVTPVMAEKLLKLNHPNNRSLNLGSVRSLAQQIVNDLWEINGETIKITEDGTLIDGQTRLRAIIMADRPAHMLFCSGLTNQAFTTLDDGMKRSFSDTLTTLGIQIKGGNSAAQSSLNNLKILQRCFLTNSSFEANRALVKKSNGDLLDFYRKLKNFDKVCEKFYSLFNRTKIGKIMPVSIAMPLYYLFEDQTSEVIFSIFKSLETGKVFDNLKEKSATHHMISRIKRRKSLDQRIHIEEYVNLFMIAYKGAILNMPMTSITDKEARDWAFFYTFDNEKVVKRKLLSAR